MTHGGIHWLNPCVQKGEKDEDRNITCLSYYIARTFLCSCLLVLHLPIAIAFCIIIHYFAFQFRSPEFRSHFIIFTVPMLQFPSELCMRIYDSLREGKVVVAGRTVARSSSYYYCNVECQQTVIIWILISTYMKLFSLNALANHDQLANPTKPRLGTSSAWGKYRGSRLLISKWIGRAHV